MNETYVSRLFQKRTGQKFSSYLTACRIQAAQTLLTGQPELSIGEVAERVGFGGDAKYFIEVFRKSVGVTPGKFRAGAKRKRRIVKAKSVKARMNARSHFFGVLGHFVR